MIFRSIAASSSTAVATAFASVALAACLRSAPADPRGPASAAPPPNIIIILADDLGWADAGFQDRLTGEKTPLRTPHLDALAARGTIFRQGYANCGVCSPTRAALLTGRYQTRFGFEFLPPAGGPAYGLPATEVTLPEILKRHGYATGMVGKWHLGSAQGQLPHHRGFDFFHGFLGAAHHYFPSGPQSVPLRPSRIQENDRLGVPFDKYLTDHFGAIAAAFIERNRHQPFFLYLPFNAVHTAADPAGLDRDMQAADADKALFPDLPPMRQEMAAAVFALDRAVGHVVATLERLGLRDRTAIFFTSDNGGRLRWGAHNGPLRDGKGSLYEGGIRVPFFATGPGIPGGVVSDVPVITMDLFATTLALAAAPMPSDRLLDSRDLLPRLRADSPAPARRLFWQFGDVSPGAFNGMAVRDGPWKLVEHGGRASLYHLGDDIGERRDRRAGEPAVFLALSRALSDWAAEQAKPGWTSQFPDGKPPGTTLRPAGRVFTYLGATGPWSAPAAWETAAPGAPSRFSLLPMDVHPANVLRFPVGATAAYRATNDVPRRGGLPHVLHALEFLAPAPGTHSGTAALDGAPLLFTRDAAGTPPRITLASDSGPDDPPVGGARIENDLSLLADELQLTGDGSSIVELLGVLSDQTPIGSPGGLRKLGRGTFVLRGARPNTFTGPLTVHSGALVLAKSAGAAAGSTVIEVGRRQAPAPRAVLWLRAPQQLHPESVVHVATAGELRVAAAQSLAAIQARGVVSLSAVLTARDTVRFDSTAALTLAPGARLVVDGDLQLGDAAGRPQLRLAGPAPSRGRHAVARVGGHLTGDFTLAAENLPAGSRLELSAQAIDLVVD